MLQEFEQTPASCAALASWQSLPDFKEQSLHRLVVRGGLQEVGQDGEIKHGSLEEFDARIKLGTFARMFQITRRAIVNDDISSLASLPRILVGEAARLRGEKFAALLADNPGSFFDASNNNYFDGASSVLSIDSVITAITKLRTMTDEDGRALNMTPTALLVHPNHEMAARQIVSSVELSRDSTIDSMPVGNAIATLNLGVEVEPRLTTTTEWYLFSRPSDAGVVVGTLNGQRTPIVEQPDSPADVLGETVRGYYDFAIGLAEPRAVVKSKGAS